MKEAVRSALAELNQRFYNEFAGDFARTRRSWPPGFDRILPHVRLTANVLDLGCGNGRFLHFLRDRDWAGRYTGVDNSAGLLEIASGRFGLTQPATAPLAPDGLPSPPTPRGEGDPSSTRFLQADLLRPDWPQRLGDLRPELIVSVAVLHHIPGAAQRASFVAQCAHLLRPGGMLILTTWQFATSCRLRARVLPWETIGMQKGDVESDDYLLSWGKDAAGHRYCAAINEETLCRMAAAAGLRTVEMFLADGKEENLNLYGVFVVEQNQYTPKSLPDTTSPP